VIFVFFVVDPIFSFEVIHLRAVVPQIFPFGLVGKRQLEKRIDGVGVFDVEVRIVRGENHIVFEAVLGNVLGRDLIAFHGSVALSLKIFQRRQRQIGILRFAGGLGVFAHAPEQPGSPGAVSLQERYFQFGKSFHYATEDHVAAGEHVGERKPKRIEHRKR
jgi:hypothetical protein